MEDTEKKYFAHASACIDAGAEIGEGSKIWHFSHIMPGARLGQNTTIGQNVMVATGCLLGNNVKVQNNVSIYSGVTLEDDVFCGPSMVFTNVINPRAFIERKDEFRATLVRRGASIGANAAILCGCTLGSYCLIGAGAVVTRDVPAFGLVVGNPGQLVGYVCYCGETLMKTSKSVATVDTKTALQCRACSRNYSLTGPELTMKIC